MKSIAFFKVFIFMHDIRVPFHLVQSNKNVRKQKEYRMKAYTYDFTTIMDRRGKDAMAVDGPYSGHPWAPKAPKEGFSLLPMWVADMNFAVPECITKAITERVKHPAFGYFGVSDAYYQAIIDWQTTYNQAEGLEAKHIGYENGVLGGVATAVQCYTAPGDAILLHSPCYIGFTGTLTNLGRKIVLSPLVQDAQGVWRMDYEDMRRKLKENHIHMAIFCSPHNPAGRVWEKEEIEQAMEVYREADCMVVSDEIWSDILLDGHKHIPTQSVSEDARQRTMALYAPSKTFNLAGLIGSYHIIYNDTMRDRIRSQSSKSHYNSMNVLSMHALIGAYSQEGRIWVDELNQVLAGNLRLFCDYLEAEVPEISFARPEGTYMLFLDCSKWCEKKQITLDQLLQAGWDVGVTWQDGRPFHGSCHIRMNLALPRSLVEEAIKRLKEYVFTK